MFHKINIKLLQTQLYSIKGGQIFIIGKCVPLSLFQKLFLSDKIGRILKDIAVVEDILVEYKRLTWIREEGKWNSEN